MFIDLRQRKTIDYFFSHLCHHLCCVHSHRSHSRRLGGSTLFSAQVISVIDPFGTWILILILILIAIWILTHFIFHFISGKITFAMCMNSNWFTDIFHSSLSIENRTGALASWFIRCDTNLDNNEKKTNVCGKMIHIWNGAIVMMVDSNMDIRTKSCKMKKIVEKTV